MRFSYYTDPSSNQLLAEGKLRPENKNPINRKMESWYTPILIFLFKMEKKHFIGKLHLLIGGLMYTRLGSEFMPPLDEGYFCSCL
jgi:Cu(I)/Ag(I) efflux system membrane protein CusA/SilA